MDIYKYIKPELLSMLPVLYVIGAALKRSAAADWKIPFWLGAIGIALAEVWLTASGLPASFTEWIKLAFCGIIQGTLCAAATVYAHNLVKQYSKRNGDGDESDDQDDTESF